MDTLTITDVFALISAAWLLATIAFIVIDAIVKLIWKFVILPRYEFCDTEKHSENMKKEGRGRNDKKYGTIVGHCSDAGKFYATEEYAEVERNKAKYFQKISERSLKPRVLDEPEPRYYESKRKQI